MKTLNRISVLFASISLFFGCSKNDQPDLPMSGSSGIGTKNQVVLQEEVFVVPRSGNDDTEALNKAFTDAIEYGSGAVVQLEEGEYFTNFIEIKEFSGKFRGAGKGKTIITTVEELDFDELLNQNLNLALIRFVGGEVYMSDMTIKSPPGSLKYSIATLVGFNARTIIYKSVNDYINAVINNVEFAGNRDNTWCGLHEAYGIRYDKTDVLWPLSCMDISVTNCSFDGFSWYGAYIQHFNGGKIIFGVKNNGNVFNYGAYGSLSLWSNVNVDISIEGNTFNSNAMTFPALEVWTSPVPRYLEQVQ